MSPVRPTDTQNQPSISNFFKRKSPPPELPKKNGSNGVKVIKLDSSILDDDEEDDIVAVEAPPPAKKLKSSAPQNGVSKTQHMSQPKSSYFGASTPAAVSINAEAGPSKPTRFASKARKPSVRSVRLDDYRMSQSQAEESPSVPAIEKSSEQKQRHEAWQRRVVGGNLVPRRRSLALDEAAAAETRRLAGDGEPEDNPEGTETPAVVDEAGSGSNTGNNSDEEKQKAASVGSKLAAKFARKGSEESVKAKTKVKCRKKEEEVGPSGQTYTPLEKQFMKIKNDNPDVLLLMEVGYRYSFHGEDAKIAARELGIACFPNRNFYTASIPVHRMNIHVKKLISLGYKVGIISQMETAALKKVGENRNAPFTRELTHLFTAATYVEDPSLGSSSTMTDDPIVPGSSPPPTNALVAIVEMGLGGMASDERVRIGLVSVVPETGDVVWDEFDDSQVRTELETRLTHLQPAELLLPSKGLSRATEKVLNHFAGNTKTSASTSIRMERIDKILEYSKAFDYLTKFYMRKSTTNGAVASNGDEGQIDQTKDSDDGMEVDAVADDTFDADVVPPLSQEGHISDPMGLAAGLPSEEAVLALVDFPKQVVIALSVAVQYMKAFKLQDAFRHRSSFTRFINRAHMLLSSNTLVNLEVYRNQTDGGIYGSLLWLLDHTRTRMGRRLLREWIGRPLLDVIALQARIDAIEEIIQNNTYHIEKLRSLLVNMPDLVKGLTRVQYGKAQPTEIATILVGLYRIGSEFKPTEGKIFESALLNSILSALPTIKAAAQRFLNVINVKAAREGNLGDLWADSDKYPDVEDAKDCINIVESELDLHLKEVRKILKRPSLQYVTVAGIEYLVEVPIKDAKSVPAKWVKVQATKHVVRFHTPDILRMITEREQHKETLSASAKAAFISFQSDISECHSLIVVSRQIAVIDCLMSLAQVAVGSGYCKPEFVPQAELHIRQGRHPMVEMLKEEAYVPFDIDFGVDEGCAKVITGPNMAGKSSCVRATALIVCMAQIGSFVPAKSVKLGIHDAVQTRMGASDEIGRGKSTFMVELSETSDILRTLTPRTLVILDELGRGTSTYDGVAIAYATLSHVAKVGCNTLFVTHYPTVAEELAREMPDRISNWHMSFDETKLPDGSAEITFLYRLTRGLAEASFGVWCARLAGLPKTVLENAQLKSDILRGENEKKAILSAARVLKKVLGGSAEDGHSGSGVKEIKLLLKAA